MILNDKNEFPNYESTQIRKPVYMTAYFVKDQCAPFIFPFNTAYLKLLSRMELLHVSYQVRFFSKTLDRWSRLRAFHQCVPT